MRISLLIVLFLLINGCSEKTSNEKPMTSLELQTWSKALNFPSYCEEGAFEGDTNIPQLNFYTLDSVQIVSAVCESFAYQNVVNLYRVNDLPSTAKVIKLLQVELNLQSVDYFDDNDKPLLQPTFDVSFFRSAQIIHKSIQQKRSNLLEITRYYNAKGSCGSITVYDFAPENPKIVSFQLQPDCESETSVNVKDWPFYKVTCQESDTHSCQLIRL